MRITLKPFEKEVKEYCENNGLDFQKVSKSPMTGDKSVLWVQHVDFSKLTGEGLMNEEPAEVLLTVTRNADGSVSFEKGKNADKYLHL